MGDNIKLSKESSKKNEYQELRDLLQKNIDLSEQVLDYVKKNHAHLLFARILSYIKIAIILIPLIVGFIYLPEIVDALMRQYGEIINISNTLREINKDLFLKILNK